MDDKPVFTARNTHSATCGQPPDVKTDPDNYFGYFESVFNRATKRGQLRGGDCGWDELFEVTVTAEGEVTGIPLLNAVEQDWLRSCLRAALGS